MSPCFRLANGNLPILEFLVAQHEHVRDLLHLSVANLRTDLIRSCICFDTKTGCRVSSSCNRLGVIVDAIRDRQHRDLNRCEPQRERTRVMLDQHAKESLDRTEQRPVDHKRTMFLIVVTGVLELKPLRQIEIKLDRSELPHASDGILDLDIDLRPVKRCLAFDPFVARSRVRLEHSQADSSPHCPIFVSTEITLILSTAANRKLKFHLVESVGLENLDREIETVRNLSLDLIGTHKKMGVIDRKSTNTHQAVQRSRKLGTINRTHFGITLRQISIRTRATTCRCRCGTGSSSA